MIHLQKYTTENKNKYNVLKQILNSDAYKKWFSKIVKKNFLYLQDRLRMSKRYNYQPFGERKRDEIW